MIERVARAMWSAAGSKEPWDIIPPDRYYYDDEPSRETVLAMARAAIIALREPSAEMIAEGSTALEVDAETVWVNMIDSILAHGEAQR